MLNIDIVIQPFNHTKLHNIYVHNNFQTFESKKTRNPFKPWQDS